MRNTVNPGELRVHRLFGKETFVVVVNREITMAGLRFVTVLMNGKTEVMLEKTIAETAELL